MFRCPEGGCSPLAQHLRRCCSPDARSGHMASGFRLPGARVIGPGRQRPTSPGRRHLGRSAAPSRPAWRWLCRTRRSIRSRSRPTPWFPGRSNLFAGRTCWSASTCGPGWCARARCSGRPTSRSHPTIHLTAGPGHSVWIGSVHARQAATLSRLDTRTGMILATARLPAKMAASDLADDPAREHLYVSAAYMVRGGTEGNAVLEYDARSGRLLTDASRGLVTYSVAGSALTAVPGGVWVSFRTGMLGLTLHLRQPDLAMVAPPGPNIAQSPATSLFHWAMYAATGYGGGALWLTNQAGIVACIDPRTGKPRAIERLRQGQLIFQLLAADPASRQLYASDSRGLVAITPPPSCWRG